MTDDRMALKALLEKGSDTELLSEMLAFVANRLMAFDVEQLATPGRMSEATSASTTATVRRQGRPAQSTRLAATK